MDAQSSKTINMAKVLLMFGVVMIHCTPWSMIFTKAWPLVNMMCRVIYGPCVPLYFVLAGYLFFRSDAFDSRIFADKLRRRVSSLLVPYLLWYLIMVAYCVSIKYLRSYIPPTIDAPSEPIQWLTGIIATCSQDHCSEYPLNVPMWFVRNLIILNLLAPLTWRLVNRLGWWLPIGIGAIRILWSFTPWTDMGAYVFYDSYVWSYIWLCLGAVMARRHVSISVPTRAAIPLSVVFIALTAVRSFEDLELGTIAYIIDYSRILSGAATFVWLAEKISGCFSETAISRAVPASFFAYCCHFMLADWLLYFFMNVYGRSSLVLVLLAAYTAMFVTVGICVSLYALLRRFAPGLAACLSGGRSRSTISKR